MKKLIALSAILISLSILIIASVLFAHYIDENIGGFAFMILSISVIFLIVMIIDETKTPNENEPNNE
ncbi:MAG: hypothetical protein ACLFPM_01440 [Candidatus Izemoplasmatales bacterium]